jgi:hypothetical protein
MTRVSLWSIGTAAAVLISVADGTASAPIGAPVDPAIGPPVLQWFMGNQSSVVETPDAVACVVSQPIDITQSQYLAADGSTVPFADVIRSYAASAQFVADRSTGRQSLRVQFKYSPAPGAPMTMRIGGRVVDLAPWLEASGDSIRITDEALVTIARAALEAGMPLIVSATSRETRRRVTDRIEGMAFSAYDACRAGPALAVREPGLEPEDRVTMAFSVFPSPETRATPEEHRICRNEDPAATLYRGRLRHVTGFVSQTQDVFVTYAEDGQIGQVYIPGIVEGQRQPDGTIATLLSIAANANDPTAESSTSGCIGPAPVALCEERAGPSHRLVQCVGTLLASDPLDDLQFLVADLGSSGAGTGLGGQAAFATASASPFGGGGGGGSTIGGFGGGGGNTSPQRPTAPGNGPGPMPVIPLPAAWLLMTGALTALGALAWRPAVSNKAVSG